LSGIGLVQREAAGDIAAAEELRAVLSEGPRPEPRFDGGRPDGRRRMLPTLEESTGMSGDDLFVKVLTNRLGLQQAPPLPGGAELMYLPAEAVAAGRIAAGRSFGHTRPTPGQPADGEVQKGRLRFPWRHLGRRHHGLG